MIKAPGEEKLQNFVQSKKKKKKEKECQILGRLRVVLIFPH